MPGTHGSVQRMQTMHGALTRSGITTAVSYVRGARGNRAAPVSEQDVKRLRAGNPSLTREANGFDQPTSSPRVRRAPTAHLHA